MNFLSRLASISIIPISASQVNRITGMSHRYLAVLSFYV
jgi:hypothetical protein